MVSGYYFPRIRVSIEIAQNLLKNRKVQQVLKRKSLRVEDHEYLRHEALLLYLRISKGRAKILRILAENRESPKSVIKRLAGLKYTTLNQHLRVLQSHCLIKHKKIGRIHIFRLNEGNPIARMIKKLIESEEQTNEI